MRQDLLDLARLQLADEVPAELGWAVALASRSWARFSPSSVRPASPEHADLLQRHVLDRGQQLDLAGSRPASAMSARPLDVGADAGGVEAADQARHTAPAWRPVMPWSRRWRRSARRRSCTGRCRDLDAVGRQLRARDRRQVEVALAAARVVGREVLVDLLADLVAAAAGARAERGRDRPSPPTSRSARTPSSTIPPASGRQPECSAATPPAASRTGRQSATKTIAAASQRRRLAVLLGVGRRPTAARGAPDGRAVDLAPVAEARPGMADELPQPAPVLGDVLRRVVGQQPEVQRRERPSDTPPRAVEKTARACGRSATIWSSSQRKELTRPPGYGVAVDRVNVSVLRVVPGRSGSVAPIACRKPIVNARWTTGRLQLRPAERTWSGCAA